MSNEIVAAAAFFVRVCLEHGRLFALRNILVAVPEFGSTDDEDRFVAEVEDVIDRYRLGEEFDEMDDTLREEFGVL